MVIYTCEKVVKTDCEKLVILNLPFTACLFLFFFKGYCVANSGQECPRYKRPTALKKKVVCYLSEALLAFAIPSLKAMVIKVKLRRAKKGRKPCEYNLQSNYRHLIPINLFYGDAYIYKLKIGEPFFEFFFCAF